MKSLKKSILVISIFTILLTIGLIFGCTQQSIVNVDIENDNNVANEKNLGSLSLTIINSQNDSRTLYPTFTTPTYYDISGDGPDTESFSFPNVTESSKNITNLVVGTWIVTVKAKDALGNIIASGLNNSVVVNKDATTDATVDITYLQTGTGIADLTIDWPDIVAIDDISLKIDSDATLDIYNGGSSIVNYENPSIATGSHTFVFKLKKGGVVFASVIESVHIYNNLTTSAIITLTADDFKKAPTAPTGLSATEGLAKIILNWTDTSNIETGFIVERSTTSGSGFAQIGTTLAANAISYEDTTAVAGTTYWYRVKATNSFGSSASTETSGKWEAPTATLTNKPTDPTNSTTAAIVVGGVDVVSYKYQLDLGGYGSETFIITDNTIDLIGLSNGDHTVDVIGKDSAGNWQATATSYTWEVNTSESIATLSNTPSNPTNATSIDITVGGTDIVSYKYKFDTDATSDDTSCDIHITKSSIAEGSHTLYVIGKTSLGNWQTDPTTFTWVVDTTAPTVTLSSAVPAKTNAPFTVTITFNETVTGFDNTLDITATNAILSNFTNTVAGTTWTVLATPIADGAVSIQVGVDKAIDAAGNGNSASNIINTVYDKTKPTVTLSSTVSNPTNTAFTVTITFNETVTGFDNTLDITATNAILSNWTNTVVGTTWTVLATPIADGAVSVKVDADKATDTAGNSNSASNVINTDYDATKPTVSITSTETSPTKADTIPITITFSESVTGFDATDITVTGGNKGALSGSGASYSMNITVATSGTVTVDIAADKAIDAAGNTNEVAPQFSIVVQFRGDISLTINLITPTSFDIAWDGTGDLILNQGQTLDVTADITGATAWRWYLDGDLISGQTAKNIDIDTSAGSMDPGLHRLDVIVTKDSLEYSAYIKFEVNN